MTSPYDSRVDVPTITRRRNVLACARCRARRVKCDRAQPACSNCTKVGAPCLPARQTTPPHGSVPSRSGSKEPIDQHRQLKVEEEGDRFSRDFGSHSPFRESSRSPPLDEFNERGPNRFSGKLKTGRYATYISPLSWASVAEEAISIDPIIETAIQEMGNFEPDISALSLQDSQVGSLPDDQLHGTLLNLYSQRVNPMIPLLHWPSFLERCRYFRQAQSMQMQSNTGPQFQNMYFTGSRFGPSQSRMYSNPLQAGMLTSDPLLHQDFGLITLMFAVYYAAAVSLVDCPTSTSLAPNIDIFDLVSAYGKEVRTRTNKLQEGFAQFQSLEMLQAMTLYLAIESDSTDVQSQCAQLVTTIHMAQGFGVHRDGPNFSLKPIETEIRRRIWTQLCILDVRYSERLCREPSIATNSYDATLPLSTNDIDLAKLERNEVASAQGERIPFKSHEEIEKEQEHLSPFSPMTLFLIEAEAAKVQQNLLASYYHASDSIDKSYPSSTQGTRETSKHSTRSSKSQWASRLERRFQSVYKVDSLDTSHPMQSLVFQLIGLKIAKLKFMTDLIEKRELPSNIKGDRKTEIKRLFQDALHIARNCLSITQQYANSRYSWYMSRLRDPYSTSFLAFCLTSDGYFTSHDSDATWSILDQLYPFDPSERIFEQALSKSLLGKVILTARLHRNIHMQISGTQGLAEHPSARGNFRINYPTVTSTGNPNITTGYQTPQNVFEGFEGIIQDPLWPGSLTGADDGYGGWSSSLHALPLCLRPKRKELSTFPYHDAPTHRGCEIVDVHKPQNYIHRSSTLETNTIRNYQHQTRLTTLGVSDIPHINIQHVCSNTSGLNYAKEPEYALQGVYLGNTRALQPLDKISQTCPWSSRKRSVSQPLALDPYDEETPRPVKRRSTSNLRYSSPAAKWRNGF